MTTVNDLHIHDGVGLRPIAVKSSVAASLIGVEKQTLSNWRCEGKGPKYVRLSANRVVYKLEDIEAWVNEYRVGGGR